MSCPPGTVIGSCHTLRIGPAIPATGRQLRGRVFDVRVPETGPSDPPKLPRRLRAQQAIGRPRHPEANPRRHLETDQQAQRGRVVHVRVRGSGRLVQDRDEATYGRGEG